MTRVCFHTTVRVLGIAGLLLALPAPRAEDPIPRRLDRKINVMEKVLDEVLRESPNWLVGGSGHYTRSVYLEEYGVIFGFDASLVSRFGGDDLGLGNLTFEWFKDLEDLRIERDGDKVIVWREGGKGDEEEDEEEGGELSFEELRQKRADRERRRYEDGKDELIDTLMDYGDTLTELRNDQFLTITVFLEDISFFEEPEITRLIIKSKVSDLRSFGDGKITRDELRKRIEILEY